MAEVAIQETPLELSAMQLIQSAIMQGAGIDTIERLAKLQREMVEYQAKVDFNEALARVQAKMSRISTDAVNPQTKSRRILFIIQHWRGWRRDAARVLRSVAGRILAHVSD
jgi:cell fate (sporulation/competence/biofilm development) regulator YmcA (YheA/YmcA/DUF963 family)